MDQSNPGVSPNADNSNTMARVIGILLLLSGLLVLVSFFMPQFTVVRESFSGPNMVRALNKDLAELGKYIGEFTTFMMYFSILFSMFVGFWVMVKGIGMLARGQNRGWIPTAVLCGVAIIISLITISLLDDGPSGSGIGMMFFRGKLMPEPAFGYYLAIYLHAGVAIMGVILAVMGRRKYSTPSALHFPGHI